ncbi:MAG: hypothetical protein E7291_08080 [Lachnospiraceae bacterium]|nr:hypothetical protein [Lachnospiraceae bacterium]
MREAIHQDKERILQYLQREVQDCIYLYIDIANYGVCSEHMKVWLEEDADSRELILVVMQYYDSFQIYSHRTSCNIAPVAELLKEHSVAMVSGRSDIIKQLVQECEAYRATYGAIYIMDRYRAMQSEVEVLLATENDTTEIAELICADEEIGGHYTVENLSAQLAERIRTGTGRSYIIRENGVIVAHSATYAEAEGIAVVGGTIIKPECRNSNYYMVLSNYMLQQLVQEGKTAYTFSISDKMIRYHDMLHTKCGEYGKMVKRKSYE